MNENNFELVKKLRHELHEHPELSNHEVWTKNYLIKFKCKAFITLNNIEEVFVIHSMSGLEYKSINVIDGTSNYASKGMIIHMEGSPTHASQPEHGKIPLTL